MKNKIIKWIKGEVSKAKAKGIVIGLSGGIDSCVAAALARQAVGTKKLLCLIIPCQSSASDLRDAKAFAKKFSIRARLVDLSGLYNNLIKILPAAGNLARNNLKPRLRMATLYYFANKYNYLVCGTGNKSEINVGYFTKFGDGGVDILPLGDLYKMQVVKLAQELGIPERIIAKPPTAGLWPGQTDEGEMGIRYAQLDDILWRLENHHPQIAAREKVRKVKAMATNSGHKRQGPKICYVHAGGKNG
ncbi:MAG: NAD+ synthase [Candidatus Omnitrophota bacterium]|nr:NAD+ synthase [Candidatus Omnitrophota bacterium]